MKSNYGVGTILLAAALMAACQDLPTTVAGTSSPQPTVARSSAAGERQVMCYVSRRVESREYPYEYGTLRINFPASSFAEDGSKRHFRYRVLRSPGDEVVVAGSCLIPNTPEAVKFIMTRLRLHERPAAKREDDDDLISIQGCVTGGVCPLDMLIVYGYTYHGPGGALGGGSGDGLDASMGGYYEGTGDGGYNYDPGPDGSYRPECMRDWQGNCINKEADDKQWDRFAQIISLIQPKNAFCAGAKAALQGLFDMGRSSMRLRVWDGWDVEDGVQRFGENRFDSDGRYIEMDSFHLFETPKYLVHEGLHAYYDSLPADNQGLIGESSETIANRYMNACW